MQRFIAGIVLGFLANWTLSFAATGSVRNGSYWHQLSGVAKTGYVDGYMDAMHFSEAKLDTLNVAAQLFHWKGAPKIIRQLSDQFSTEGFVSGEAIKHLDQLYSNEKFSELDTGQALQLVAVRARTAELRPLQPGMTQ